jgi:hypothetical protein
MNNPAIRSEQLITQMNSVASGGYQVCSICDEFSVSQSNFLISCKICKTSIHIDCWKFADISKFICRRCKYAKAKDIRFSQIKCKICGKYEGFMIQRYYNKQFLHLRCVNGLRSKYNVRNQCFYCDDETGTVIKCGIRTCEKKFHHMCCEREGFYKTDQNGNRTYYCENHYKHVIEDGSRQRKIKDNLMHEVFSTDDLNRSIEKLKVHSSSDTDSAEELPARRERPAKFEVATKSAQKTPRNKRLHRMDEVIDLVTDSDSEECLEITGWILLDPLPSIQPPSPSPASFSISPTSIISDLPASFYQKFPYITS